MQGGESSINCDFFGGELIILVFIMEIQNSIKRLSSCIMKEIKTEVFLIKRRKTTVWGKKCDMLNLQRWGSFKSRLLLGARE